MDNKLSFAAWRQIYELSAWEAACLLAGVDPALRNMTDHLACAPIVYERMIREAVSRADNLAWNLFDDREPEEMPKNGDIWGENEERAAYLPTIEMRESIKAVLADPINRPLLLVIDPWYSATVDAKSFNKWLACCEVETEYLFEDHQQIVVVSIEQNRDSVEQRALDTMTDQERRIKDERFRQVLGRMPGATPLMPETPGVKTPSNTEHQIGTRERNTLLSIIGVLAKIGGLEVNTAAKTASIIVNAAISQGISLGETTVEGHLKKVAAATAARQK